MSILLEVYQSFPDPTVRKDFMNFCASYLEGEDRDRNIYRINDFLKVYKSLPTPQERQAFMDFYILYLKAASKGKVEYKQTKLPPGFAPYLGHSIYYDKPDALKGDEMLGRIWFYMKAIAKNTKDEELNKRSVIISMVEAAELSGSSTNTHCQTRMTGELMKLLAFNLEGSKLLPLIAGNDLPPATNLAAMQAAKCNCH